MAPAHEVDQHSHPLHENGSVVDALLAVGDEGRLRPEPRQPSGRQDVSESAGTLLQIRFQVEDGVLEALMALSGQAVDPKAEFPAPGSIPPGKKFVEGGDFPRPGFR